MVTRIDVPSALPPRSKHTVLLIHDDESFLEGLIERMRRDGRFEVLSADNAFDAGRMTRERVPELIMISTQLQDLDVSDALRKVRSARGLEGLRVVCYGAASEQEATKLIAWGADEALPRHCDVDAIITAIRRLLGLAPPEEGPAGAPVG
ncbi:MAG: response regulator [Planctomycetes bacterium]|nr:response regulator [Planctomycetota bacterium]